MIRTGIIQQQNTADIQDNMKRLALGIEQLAKEGAQLIVLQELHNSLYFCQGTWRGDCYLAVREKGSRTVS